MSEDFEREERAFAEALRKDAPVGAFRPLDPEAVRAAAGPVAGARRSRWLKGLAAAAAVVVVAGAGAVILPGMFGGSGHASTVSGAPEVHPAGGAGNPCNPVSRIGTFALPRGNICACSRCSCVERCTPSASPFRIFSRIFACSATARLRSAMVGRRPPSSRTSTSA